MDRVKSIAAAVAVLLTTAVAAPALAGVATAQQGQQIDECTVVDESGVYELNDSIGGANASENVTDQATNANETAADDAANNTSLSAETGVVADDVNASACIAVEANDVTVDGNGHTLDGSDASELNLTGNDSNATNASGAVNESVVNGIVVRPAPGNDSVSNVTVTNVTVKNWYVGVYIQNASGVTLDNVTFANNTVPGFRLDNSTDLTIRGVNQSAGAG